MNALDQAKAYCSKARALLIAAVSAKGKEQVAADLIASVRTVERIRDGTVPSHNLARRIHQTFGGRTA